MAVFVDHSRLAWRGKSWCHLVADTVTELHDFAAQLGLKRSWFQDRTLYPHYDVTVSVRLKALAMGAVPADKRTIVTCAKRMHSELILAHQKGIHKQQVVLVQSDVRRLEQQALFDTQES